MHATPIWRARYVGERLAHQLLGSVTGLAYPCLEPAEGSESGLDIVTVTLAVHSVPRFDPMGAQTYESELSWRLVALVDSGEYRWVDGEPLAPGAPQRTYGLRSVRFDVIVRIVDTRGSGQGDETGGRSVGRAA